MRPTNAMLKQTLSLMARPASLYRSAVWCPNYGIVFGSTSKPTPPDLTRELSTISSIATHRDFLHRSAVEDSYMQGSSAESVSSSSECSHSALLSGSDLDYNNWTFAIVSQDPTTRDGGSEVDATLGINLEPRAEGHTPLTFKIPREVLEKAKDAVSGTKESFWSYKIYKGPGGQGVQVHYCKSKHAAENVVKYFVNEPVIGFDIEWKPDSTKNAGIKNNVSLIQIASETRIGLFHIALFPKDTAADLVAPTLKKIMEDPGVTKLGVSIKADCTRLRNYLKIESRSIFELSHLYKLVKYSSSGEYDLINKKLVSVATQAEEHLELPICKGDVRGSDWTKPLSVEQILYAASDAYANFMLYDTMEYKRKQLRPLPPRPYHAELNLPIRLAMGAVVPTMDETLEEVESEAPPAVTSSSLPVSALEAAAENIQIEEDEPIESMSKPSLKLKTKSTESKPPGLPVPKTQEVIDAEAWAISYRNAKSALSTGVDLPATASFSTLRVYALWNFNPKLSMTEIAAMLRDPPLQKSTICTYVLEAVRLEKLPFEKGRIKDILRSMPDSSKVFRYKGLWKMVD